MKIEVLFCVLTASKKTVVGNGQDTCAVSGFAENFNAVTGDPLRDPAYTWTSSVFLTLAREFLADR